MPAPGVDQFLTAALRPNSAALTTACGGHCHLAEQPIVKISTQMGKHRRRHHFRLHAQILVKNVVKITRRKLPQWYVVLHCPVEHESLEQRLRLLELLPKIAREIGLQ